MADRELPAPRDDQDRWLLGTVARVGWAVIGIPEDDEGPGFVYSIGLGHTFGHPEVLLMGLALPAAHRIINLLGQAVRDGARFDEPGRRHDGLAAEYPLAFVPMAGRYYADYLGWAIWFYQGANFPAVQAVWPDEAGVFPWEPGYDSRFFDAQRILSRGPGGDS